MGFWGAGIRLKTVAVDACTLVAGRDLPAVIVKARDAFSVDLTDGPRRSAGAGIDFIGIGPGRWLALALETGLAQRLEAALAPAASIFEQAAASSFLRRRAAPSIVSWRNSRRSICIRMSSGRRGGHDDAAHVNMTFWRCEGGAWRSPWAGPSWPRFLRLSLAPPPRSGWTGPAESGPGALH